jgi:APA family basic amino acid/polyamine antiporter
MSETEVSLFWRKSMASLTRGDGEGLQLRRALGPVSLVMLGIGCIIGAGLFALTGIVASQNTGPAVVLSFVVAAVGCGFAGLCYAELASMIPRAGSAYTYAYATMGELVAWIIGWDLVLEYSVAAAAVAVSWSGYVVRLLASFGIVLPVQYTSAPWSVVKLADGTMAHGIVNLPALFIIVVLSLLLIRGVTESAVVNNIIVTVKVAVVLAVLGFGIPYIHAGNYHPFIPANTGTLGSFGFSGIMRGAGVLFFAYVGFDAVSTAAQEARNPARDMPIGIIGSLAICTVLYIAFGAVLTGMLNYHAMLNDPTPVASAIALTGKPWLVLAVTVGIIGGYTTVILTSLYGQSRVFYSMATDGLLPPVFARIHPILRTPYLSHLIFMVFTGALAAFLPIQELGEMTSIGTLLAFIIVCIGVMMLRRSNPDHPRRFKVMGSPAIPVLGILSCLAMMVFLNGLVWVRLIVWLAIGLLIYAFYGRRHAYRD